MNWPWRDGPQVIANGWSWYNDRVEANQGAEIFEMNSAVRF